MLKIKKFGVLSYVKDGIEMSVSFFQLANFQDRVGKLEQEKEHWMLELQLLQIKYDNEIQVKCNIILWDCFSKIQAPQPIVGDVERDQNSDT